MGYIIRVPEEARKGLKNIWSDKSWKFPQHGFLKSRKQRGPYRINPRRNVLRQTVIKMTKIKHEAYYHYFFFLGHTYGTLEVPWQRGELELQLPVYATVWAMPDLSCICDLAPQLTATPDPLTHWARPGIDPAPSWILVWLITTEPQWELLITIKY